MNPAEELLAHVAAALAVHNRRMAQEGLPTPPAVLVVAEWAADCVRSRQDPTALDVLVDLLDGARMDRLLLTKPEAARSLGLSVRTLERLISDGALSAVRVEGSVRVRRADLDAYVAALGSVRSFRDDLDSKGAA